MAQTTTRTTDTSTSELPATTEEREARDAAAPAVPEPKVLDALHTETGDTMIAEAVVQKIAGIAAREVPGVHAIGNAARRAFNQLTERIPGSQTNVSGGISVEKGERQAAIDLSIVVEYGVSVVEVANAIRKNIIDAVEYGTGLQVIEVNITVADVHLPDERDDDTAASRPSDRLA